MTDLFALKSDLDNLREYVEDIARNARNNNVKYAILAERLPPGPDIVPADSEWMTAAHKVRNMLDAAHIDLAYDDRFLESADHRVLFVPTDEQKLAWRTFMDGGHNV